MEPDQQPLSNSHDLRLPAWGPYTKKYTGISHLPDLASGLRFDLSVFPGFYRRQVLVPNAKWESGDYPWQAASDLSFYSYRYELEWKDQVYCDVSFSQIDARSRLVRAEFVNNSAVPQNLVLHSMASMNFPPLRTYSDEILQPARIQLPPGALWVDALDYADLGFSQPRPQDTLNYDGLWRAEVRGNGFVNGSGIGQGFGAHAGDWVAYEVNVPESTATAFDPMLVMRYRAPQGAAAFEAAGLAAGIIRLPACTDFSWTALPLADLQSGTQTIKLVSTGSAPVELDGFALASFAQVGQIMALPVQWSPEPALHPGPSASSLLLQYPDVDTAYGLAWRDGPWEIRTLLHDELDRFLRYYVQEHVQKVLVGNRQGHFTNIFLRPIEVQPGQRRVLYSLVSAGEEPQVKAAIDRFTAWSAEDLENFYRQAQARAVQLGTTSQGEPLRFSQERMAATLLTNVVYPVYTRRSYIRHFTPGKWWDCLYTWDSGFIGLGLLELDVQRAIDVLNAYTTPPGDRQAAFLHHGSLVPVQHYLFHELWNRTQDRALLEYFYPRLRQYYRFFAGHTGSSTTNALNSGLLKTWDYFYNSGGWDDYPPQVQVHAQHLEDRVTPVISTAHGIRIARMMQWSARALGLSDAVMEYQMDIDRWTAALLRWSWDAESGYFGYVCHDEQKNPLGILRHTSGVNFDMGIDGASPYFADACTPDQERQILAHLSSPDHLWTPIGTTTVDQAAPYYRVDGYWNGAVWFPQQWFFWKSLLDHGEADFAHQIAATALATWQAEVVASYHCFEHFIVQSGRGAGWHQFGGLSTPVLSWFSAYHRPGHLTVGFDAWIETQAFSCANQKLTAKIHFSGAAQPTLLAAMHPGEQYQATWEGQPVEVNERYPGLLEITLPIGQKPMEVTTGVLAVAPRGS